MIDRMYLRIVALAILLAGVAFLGVRESLADQLAVRQGFVDVTAVCLFLAMTVWVYRRMGGKDL